MANEFTTSLSLKVENGSFSYSRSWGSKKTNQAGLGGLYPGTVSAGTVEGSVVMTGYGFCVLQNLDAANYVQIGFATGSYKIRLRPGGPPLYLELEPATTIFYKANLAACEIDIIGFKL